MRVLVGRGGRRDGHEQRGEDDQALHAGHSSTRPGRRPVYGWRVARAVLPLESLIATCAAKLPAGAGSASVAAPLRFRRVSVAERPPTWTAIVTQGVPGSLTAQRRRTCPPARPTRSCRIAGGASSRATVRVPTSTGSARLPARSTAPTSTA